MLHKSRIYLTPYKAHLLFCFVCIWQRLPTWRKCPAISSYVLLHMYAYAQDQFASCQHFKINEPLRYDSTVFVSHSPSTKSMISIRGSFWTSNDDPWWASTDNISNEELRVFWCLIINNSYIVELPSAPRRKGNKEGTPWDKVILSWGIERESWSGWVNANTVYKDLN